MHRCSWTLWSVETSQGWAIGAKCECNDPSKNDAVILADEIERRLNATEFLSAEDAERAAGHPDNIFDVETGQALRNYAKTLRPDGTQT